MSERVRVETVVTAPLDRLTRLPTWTVAAPTTPSIGESSFVWAPDSRHIAYSSAVIGADSVGNRGAVQV